MVRIISKTIKLLTGQHSSRQPTDEILLEALYSTYLLSDIKQPLFDNDDKKQNLDSCNHQGLFIEYQDKFMLMNINSPLAMEVIQIQKNIYNLRNN